MRESDEQFLERFQAEIEPVVQPLGQHHRAAAGGGGWWPRRAYRSGRRQPGRPDRSLILQGDSVLEAAAGFEARIAEARLALAFREVVRA